MEPKWNVLQTKFEGFAAECSLNELRAAKKPSVHECESFFVS